jgi:hypothetical protein
MANNKKMPENLSENELYDDYINALNDLTFNSKPMINTLTIIAEENKEHKETIIRAIRDEMLKVKFEMFI